MPNNPFRHKRGYEPVSGALKTVRRKEVASNQRSVSSLLANNELGGANGTPSPVSQTAVGLPDSYDPYDKSTYYL